MTSRNDGVSAAPALLRAYGRVSAFVSPVSKSHRGDPALPTRLSKIADLGSDSLRASRSIAAVLSETHRGLCGRYTSRSSIHG